MVINLKVSVKKSLQFPKIFKLKILLLTCQNMLSIALIINEHNIFHLTNIFQSHQLTSKIKARKKY